MKKVVAAFATTSVIVLGATTMNVSAAEYEVEKNDTLWGISQEYGTTVDQLMNNNDLDSTIIYPGQTIHTENEAKAESSDTSSNKGTYTVEKGDTLSGIALLHGVTVNELQDWNSLSSTLIVAGQDLTIKGVEQEEAANTSEQAESESTNEEQTNESEETSNEASEEENTNNSVESVSNEESNESEETQATEEESNESEEVSNETAKAEASEEETATEESSNNAEGETMSVTATAYTAKCDGCSGVSATGIDLENNPDKKVIAVDPDVIPLGSKVHVEGYGEAIAGDVGSAINGDKIDLHMPTKDEANNWGVQTVNVTVLD